MLGYKLICQLQGDHQNIMIMNMETSVYIHTVNILYINNRYMSCLLACPKHAFLQLIHQVFPSTMEKSSPMILQSQGFGLIHAYATTMAMTTGTPWIKVYTKSIFSVNISQ